MTNGKVVRRRGKQARGGKPVRVFDDDKDGSDSMGSFGKCFFLLLLSLCFVLLLLLTAVAAAYFYPSDIEPVAYSLPPPPDLVGPLARNDLLRRAEKHFVNQIHGPESLVHRNGLIYTGTADGKVVRINFIKNTIETVVEFGIRPCGTYNHEPTCGRPLGMRFDSDGHLIVIDTYLGLYKVNVTSKEVVKHMLSPKVVGRGPTKFLNDLDIDPVDGVIYMSDSSTKFQRRDYYAVWMEGTADGRLLRFDPKTKKLEVLIDELVFPNGVQLTHDGQAVLVAEGSMSRVWKYHIRGPKAGEKELFADNLPGFIDNIRKSSRGGYWIGLALGRNSDKFNGQDFLSDKPFVRKMMYNVASAKTMIRLIPQHGTIVELDNKGNVSFSLQDPSGKHIDGASEVEDVDGVLYIGSYHAPYIAKLDLSKI